MADYNQKTMSVDFGASGWFPFTYPQPALTFSGEAGARFDQINLRSPTEGSHLPRHVLATKGDTAANHRQHEGRSRTPKLDFAYIPHSDRPVESSDHDRERNKEQCRKERL